MSEELSRSTLGDELADASSVLFLTPSLADGAADVCTELLTPRDPGDENILWVSYTKSPDAQLRRWREHGHGPPANLGLVSVQESSRSASLDGNVGGDTLPEGPVETVSSASDLTGLGINISKFLSRWQGNDNRTVVCFDSLTAMLQYVDVETAYEFLHVVTGRFYAADAVAHFHMDPGAHDSHTVESIVSLCDAVVEMAEDGDLSVRTR